MNDFDWNAGKSNIFLNNFNASKSQKITLDDSFNLNSEGMDKIRDRLSAIIKDNGLPKNLSFGTDEKGKIVLLKDHPDKEDIESLLNDDTALKEIRQNHANSAKTEQNGAYSTNGYDTAQISDEAMKLYEESQNGAVPDFISEWKSSYHSRPTALTVEQSKELHETGRVAGSKEDKEFLLGDAVRDLSKTKNWLESEIKGILKEAGLDPSVLKDLRLNINYGDPNSENKYIFKVAAGQKGIDKKLMSKIEGALNKPENQEVAETFDMYLQSLRGVGSSLQQATGLNASDWKDIMSGGVDLNSVNNEGMQALLAKDPELKSALENLFASDFLAATDDVSTEFNASNAVRGLADAIWTGIGTSGGASALGLSKEEADDLYKNLKITMKNGVVEISGTKNAKVLGLVQQYVDHYTSGPFAESLEKAALLNKAKYGAENLSDTADFTITFDDKYPSSTAQFGGGYTEEEETAIREDVAKDVTNLVNEALKDNGFAELRKTLDVSIGEDGKVAVKNIGKDASSRVIESVIEQLNKELDGNLKQRKNGVDDNDPLTDKIYGLMSYGKKQLQASFYSLGNS